MTAPAGARVPRPHTDAGVVRGTVGALPWEAVLERARELAAIGGAQVPPEAAELTDLAVTGAQHILAVSRTVNRDGAAIMSSGGTTGQPKLTYVAHHHALERLSCEWRPVEHGDTMLNLFTPGRMWASHYYMQALAERSGCHAVPTGSYTPEEVAGWTGIFREVGVNVLAGTPTSLADFAQGVRAAGVELPVRKLIWMAEPWTPAKEQLVRETFPGVEFFGNYGSVETYVMATNTPACDATVLHLMPDQIIEADDGGALLTRIGDGWTVPTVRYRLGDRVAAAHCRCGRPDGLRVLGRADDAISVHSVVVRVAEVLDVMRAAPGVREAQLVLTRAPEGGHTVEELCVRYAGDIAPEAVRELLLDSFYHLRAVSRGHPEAFTAEQVTQVERVARTQKIPPMRWRE